MSMAAKLFNRTVRVKTAADGSPLVFYFQGRRKVALVLDTWREVGEWWEGQCEGERTVYRVETDSGGVYELGYRHGDAQWVLFKAYD